MNPHQRISTFLTCLATALTLHAETPKDFTLESPTHDTKFTLSQAKGRQVALHFLLKTECPFCLRHTHDYAALAATTPDVVHVFIKPDSAAEIKKWSGQLSRDGLRELPVIYRDPDAKLARAFGIPDGYQFHGEVMHYPALVLLGPEGKEVFRYVGTSNADRMSVTDFKARLAKLLPGGARSAPAALMTGLLLADVPQASAAPPAGATADSPYCVTVEGRPVAIYQAHTWDPGYVPSYGGPYWFCSFDMAGPVQVEVSTARPLDRLEVLPESRGMLARIVGTNAVLQFTRPGQIVFAPDGKNGPLLLFANPPEPAPPEANDPKVRFFGPGLHRAGAIQLTNNQTLYLAAGAVVQGGIHARGTNITIRGRGILDGHAYPRFQGPTRYPVLLENCRDVTVEGIVVRDGWSWTFVPGGCDRVCVENVKLLSARVENGDGFDIVNSRNVTIANCFVRSDDDSVTPKGMGARWQGFYGDTGSGAPTARPTQGLPVENLRVENCVLWSDRAHIWRIGCESQAEAFRNFVFRNIDVIHFPDLWTPDEVPFCISLEPSEGMVQENILFEDIRIRTAGQRGLIDVRPKVTQWARQPVPGRIQNVVFRNVSFNGPTGPAPGRIRVSGPGPHHSVANVRFENVTRNGEALTATAPGVELLGFIEGLSFTPGTATSDRTIPAAGTEPRRHPPIVLIEARQARGVIAAPGGADGPFKDAVARLQQGLKRVTGTTLPVEEVAKPGPAVILGDSPQAAAEGLKAAAVPPGGFELLTLKERVLIVGDAAGVLRGVNAFMVGALHYAPDDSLETGTDLVVAPLSLTGRPE